MEITAPLTYGKEVDKDVDKMQGVVYKWKELKNILRENF